VPADVTATTVDSVLCDDLGSSVLETVPVVPSSTRLDVPTLVTATTVESVLCDDLSSLVPQSDVSVDLTALLTLLLMRMSWKLPHYQMNV